MFIFSLSTYQLDIISAGSIYDIYILVCEYDSQKKKNLLSYILNGFIAHRNSLAILSALLFG